jgi:hypothetical protein
MGEPITTGALLAATGLTTAASIKQSKDATKASDKAEKAKQRIANMKAVREKRNQISQRRTLTAGVENAGATQGTQGSSGESGAIASIGAQTAANLSFIDSNVRGAAQVSKHNRSAARSTNRSGAFAAVAGVSSSLTSESGVRELFQ